MRHVKIIFFITLFLSNFFIFKNVYSSNNNDFTNRHLGKIFIQVEEKGEAWYVNPFDKKRYFLGRPKDAFDLMVKVGVGITNSDLNKITHSSFLGSNNNDFTNRHLGKIFIQVEEKGEAWYVNPFDKKRYFLGRPKDAFDLMVKVGVGITSSDLNKIIVADVGSIANKYLENKKLSFIKKKDDNDIPLSDVSTSYKNAISSIASGDISVASNYFTKDAYDILSTVMNSLDGAGRSVLCEVMSNAKLSKLNNNNAVYATSVSYGGYTSDIEFRLKRNDRTKWLLSNLGSQIIE